ncbi:GPI inositol-deacylase PGAP1-like protein [Heracleum sosnowskyi]|uniref:GPI inositol-deacylase PGAP1-like protein n=1 Tax=Heracleum sosnowskyi TaxID=360622 RepID=A0AAD8MZY5_9APIA|nr:GPI inositol-deacylase PGAP1-like protein [Heracleum sosnowskyi]
MDYKKALLKDLTQVPSSSTIRSKNLSKKSSTSVSPGILQLTGSTYYKHLRYYTSSRTCRKRSVYRSSGNRLMSSRRFRGLVPLMGYTENNSATYLSSGDPCLDFFFHVVPDTPQSQIVGRLEASWDHDPLTTLKLICNLRGVRGTGKIDKEGFYTAALWLHDHHPKTLASNVHVIANFGYFKDLLEILFRIIQGHDARSKLKQELESSRAVRGGRRVWKKPAFNLMSSKERKDIRVQVMIAKWKLSAKRAQVPREVRIERNKAKVIEDKENARTLRKKKQMDRTKKAQELYKTDMKYRFLHDQIATFFANLLKVDTELLNSGMEKNISLAGKWCPTIDSSYDKHTLICASIAKKVFPLESYPEYEGLEDAHYVYRVRDRLRKQVLVPLHKALKLPEVFMSAKDWSLLPYNRVASIAMTKYSDIFMDRDKERFSQYLEKVKQGKAKIASGALLPHDILSSCLCGDTEGQRTLAELQWNGMVDDLLNKGKLTNCIAVCDVSGSMIGTPMEVAVALGLLISELSEEPWKGHVITFSEKPQLHFIKGSTLLEKSEFIRNMKWNMNTNFQRVFDKILKAAVDAKLSEDQMIKTVFVFSDMEFDKASATPWETDYMVIQKKFKKNGYERVPNIVFWNLRNSSATPVKITENGVAMLSGYSKNLLTLFLGGEGEINPQFVLEAAISGEEYQNLVVYD